MASDTADDRLAAALTRMPLFPLPNVVLFPNASLRLHIFEERYRAMTRDILIGERFLAMGLIAEGASPSDERLSKSTTSMTLPATIEMCRLSFSPS